MPCHVNRRLTKLYHAQSTFRSSQIHFSSTLRKRKSYPLTYYHWPQSNVAPSTRRNYRISLPPTYSVVEVEVHSRSNPKIRLEHYQYYPLYHYSFPVSLATPPRLIPHQRERRIKITACRRERRHEENEKKYVPNHNPNPRPEIPSREEDRGGINHSKDR
jgi:hypothetical protein